MNLFIDTTQKTCNLCLFEKTKIYDKFSIETNNNLTDIVVELIEKLLKKNKIKRSDIKVIYLTVGPGSFTGVRVGTLIAKA
jgi:tRNA threonylcarbamoyl adenosine modification protein YeaZ